MDLFDKAYHYHDAEEIINLGLYPYFRVNEGAVDTTVIMNGRKTVMIGSNNYLGLTSDPEVKEAAIKAIEKYGTGCTGSRFLNGTIDLHVELEERLARFMKKEAALVFSTGFTTNLGVISTIVGKNDIVISDRTNHASILDGCRMALGKFLKFRHNDMEDLERILINIQDKKVGKLIVVDGVFSMEGDLADLKHIVPLAKKHGCRLMVDEAHSLGVLGKGGRGTCEELGVLDKVDLVMGTFSKSFASLGGFIAGEEKVISFLKHNARTFMFQAAPPPAAVASALAALGILEREPKRRLKLWENVHYMLKEIQGMGFKTSPTQSAIIPILIGDDLKTFQFAKMLEQEGVYVNPVVSPAVPPGMASLRTSYTATHSRQELDYALEKLKKIGTELCLIGPNAPGAPIDIHTINDEKSEQMNFLKLPWKIYTRNHHWVPPIISDVEMIFNQKENVFYTHGEAKAFLAYRGSEIVGRIVAAIDHRANRYHNERAGFFGFFEVDKDYRAATALLDAAKQWLSDRDIKIMRGPMAFSQLEGMGCLVEGFDYPPAIMMPYNPAYYSEFFEKYGFEKAKDLYAYWMDAREPFSERFEKLADHTRKKEGIVLRHIHMSRFHQEMNTMLGILNDAYSQEFGFTPLSDSDLRYFSAKLRPVIEKELVNFVEVKGKPVAFSMILPDYNEVLKRFNGRVGIADMLNFYFYSKKIKTLRFTLLAVRKAFQRRGLETLLYLESFRVAKARGYMGGELSWIREDNNLLNKVIETNGGKHIKTYRVYQLNL
jgi:8-amino-7-oxononanoate synthase